MPVTSAFALLLSKVTKAAVLERKVGNIIERTISASVGIGSVAHNGRVFHAKNTDPKRSHLNRCYCNENIKKVYEELFGEALQKYNAKQTRSDRKIKNYYEKIRTSKQEKTFHELILQIGNCEDTNAQSEEGRLAAKILDEYMQTFQKRNPHLRVFAAHLHMDESTPHLHIDFVPFTTESKRGLETRVSLKSALADQGIVGGSKHNTEWNQFVEIEKQVLEDIMQREGIDRKELGTHEKHLSVLDYEKKMRTKEVEELEFRISNLSKNKDNLEAEITKASAEKENIEEHLDELQSAVNDIETEVSAYYQSPEWITPEPKALQSPKTYKEKFIDPFVERLKKVIASLISKVHDLMQSYDNIVSDFNSERKFSESLLRKNRELQQDADELEIVKQELGEDTVEKLLTDAYNKMQADDKLDPDQDNNWEMKL